GAGGNNCHGATHFGAAGTPYGAFAASPRGVYGGGTGGHFISSRSAAAIRTQAGYVRSRFAGYSYFNRGWYTAHPGAWRAAAWTAAAYWRWAPYATVASYCGFAETPVVYDYGSAGAFPDEPVSYNRAAAATAPAATHPAPSPIT